MLQQTRTDALATVRGALHPLADVAEGYAPLLARLGPARCVLLGEASHGTHEFYAARAAITRQLIVEHGFTAVAVEADWPDAYRVNCYVCGLDHDADAAAALGGFERFPTWMWRNTVVRDFVQWLREHNASLPRQAPRVGFYGLDLYSLFGSMQAVLRYLERVDPAAASRARERYGCFERFGEDSQAYGWATGLGMNPSCERAVIEQLLELQRRAGEYATRDGRVAEDEYFYAQQNARLVKNAEEYYRSMFLGQVSTWNLRDCHMAETLAALLDHLDRHGGRTRIVVWAHNSHLGDARATEMGDRGELNLGQLARERYGQETVSVGFSTYTGTVTAADDWDSPARCKRVRPGLPGSYEELFHQAGQPRYLLTWRRADALAQALRGPRLERAIGVIYRPETERHSHYFQARLSEQFDALVYFDETRAVEPLDRGGHWEHGDVPETYPSAL